MKYFPLYFVLRKLPQFVAKPKALTRINLSLVSYLVLCVCNGGQTNFVVPSEHELWLIM